MAQNNPVKYRAVATKPQREGGHGMFFARSWVSRWYPEIEQAMSAGDRYQLAHPGVNIHIEDSLGNNLTAGMGV